MKPKLNKPAELEGRSKDPERKCIASGEVHPKDDLLRYVVSPEGLLVLDIQQTLPGRGIWISCQRQHIDLAIKKGLFSRSAKQKIEVPENLSDITEKILAERCLNLLGLCRKTGLLKSGFAKVEASLRSKKAAVLIAARDGAEDGRQKLSRLGTQLPLIEIFSCTELSQALGLENAVHIALSPDGLTNKFLVGVSKLNGFRNADDVGERTGSE